MALPNLKTFEGGNKTANELSGLKTDAVLIKFTAPAGTGNQMYFRSSPFGISSPSLQDAVKFELLDSTGATIKTSAISDYFYTDNYVTAGADYYLKVTSTTPYANVFIANQNYNWLTFSKLSHTVTASGFTQAEVDAAVAAGKVGLFTQAEVDTKVTDAITIAGTTAAAHEAAAIAKALADAGIDTTPKTVTNPVTFDKTDPNGVVTLYKSSAGYTATATDTEIKANSNDNVITGNGLNMKITSGAGNDTINGGAGNDSITGDAGKDSITSGAGNDTINGGADNDLVNGEAGDDAFHVGNGFA